MQMRTSEGKNAASCRYEARPQVEPLATRGPQEHRTGPRLLMASSNEPKVSTKSLHHCCGLKSYSSRRDRSLNGWWSPRSAACAPPRSRLEAEAGRADGRGHGRVESSELDFTGLELQLVVYLRSTTLFDTMLVSNRLRVYSPLGSQNRTLENYVQTEHLYVLSVLPL